MSEGPPQPGAQAPLRAMGVSNLIKISIQQSDAMRDCGPCSWTSVWGMLRFRWIN